MVRQSSPGSHSQPRIKEEAKSFRGTASLSIKCILPGGWFFSGESFCGQLLTDSGPRWTKKSTSFGSLMELMASTHWEHLVTLGGTSRSHDLQIRELHFKMLHWPGGKEKSAPELGSLPDSAAHCSSDSVGSMTRPWCRMLRSRLNFTIPAIGSY